MYRFLDLRTLGACALLLPTLLLFGCGSKDKDQIAQLNEQIQLQQQEIQQREQAAEICEEIFEAEQQRYLNLERLTRMKFVEPLNDPVLDDDTLNALSKDTRLQIQDQIQFYQVKVADQVNQLMEMNEALQRQIAGVGRSVNTEAESIRRAGVEQTEELRSEIVASSMQLGQYLEHSQKVSGRIEQLIQSVQSFDQEEINCSECWDRSLRKAAERQAKKERLQTFSTQLVQDLAGLQSLSSGTQAP